MFALTNMKSGRSVALSALRRWRDLSRTQGGEFPPRGKSIASAAATFLVAATSGTCGLAPSTLITYLFSIRRFARLALDEADESSYDRHPLVELVAERIQRIGVPKFDFRSPFPLPALLAALADEDEDLATRAVAALMWDGLCRAGAVLSEACAHGEQPLPLSALRTFRMDDFPAFQLVIQDKRSAGGERVVVSADPSSASYNPASCGAPFIVERYMAWRGHRGAGPLWIREDGSLVRKHHLADMVSRKLPAGARVTPHCFRISSASWLYASRQATVARIAALGRWRKPNSVLYYLRASVPFLIRAEHADLLV